MTEDAQAVEPEELETDVETSEDQPTDQGAKEEPPKEASEEPSDPSPEKSGVQKRINELTWKQRETERQLQAISEENARLKEQQTIVKPDETVKTLEDFEYDEGQYQSYVFEQAQRRAEDTARRIASETLSDSQARAKAQQQRTDFEAKEVSYSEDLPDYYDVTRNMPLTKEMFEATAGMDEGPSVLYYLGKHQDIAGKLADLPPTAAAVEIGKIAAKLAVEKTTSKAPPPPPKIEGVDPAISKNFMNDDNISQQEWNEHRRKYIAKQRG